MVSRCASRRPKPESPATASFSRRNRARRAEERFRALFELSPDRVALAHRADGRLIEVNASFLAMTGYDRQEIIGQTSLELGLWVHPGDREEAFAMLGRTGICQNLPARMRQKDRPEIEADFSARQLDLDGVPCLLCIIRDVDDRRRLEAQVAHSQRMEAIGRLAGGLGRPVCLSGSADSARFPGLPSLDVLRR